MFKAVHEKIEKILKSLLTKRRDTLYNIRRDTKTCLTWTHPYQEHPRDSLPCLLLFQVQARIVIPPEELRCPKHCLKKRFQGSAEETPRAHFLFNLTTRTIESNVHWKLYSVVCGGESLANFSPHDETILRMFPNGEELRCQRNGESHAGSNPVIRSKWVCSSMARATRCLREGCGFESRHARQNLT